MYSRCGPTLPQPFQKQNLHVLLHTLISVDCPGATDTFWIAWADPKAEQTQAGGAVLTVTNLTVSITGFSGLIIPTMLKKLLSQISMNCVDFIISMQLRQCRYTVLE